MEKSLKVAQTRYQAVLRLVSDGLEEAVKHSTLQYQTFPGLGDRS